METMWRNALLVGRWLWPYLRNAAPVTLMLAVIAVLVVTWWLGPRWQINHEYPLAAWQMRALVTLAVVLLVVMVWGWVMARRLGRVNRDKADQQRQQEDPILVFERRQQRLLDRQLKALKESVTGRNGLYRLPWYLVIGLENAGKSSLIQRAGQSYTLSNVTRNARTERNPLGFEWWIGDNGVLIDPDGELLSQAGADGRGEMPQRLWQHFVGWLEQNRPRRPLNGVVVTVDLAQLTTASAEQRRSQAITLRARLRELMEQLGCRLPVYVSFTKMDLLYGFAPCFRQLSKAERQQPFGFTFRVDGARDPDEWLDEFDAQYRAMLERLNQRLPHTLAQTRDGEERAAIYSFTRQMAGIGPALSQFLTDFLCADAFSTPALVRGAFFTSVYQEGVPEDAFVTAAAAGYGLAAPIQSAQRQGQSISYFSEALFPSVVYPEAGLAGDNRRVVRSRRRRMAVAAVVFLAAGLGMTAGWQHYFIKNAEAASRVDAGVEHFIANWRPLGYEPDTTGRKLLGPLDQLRDATLAFGDYRDRWPLISDMGLYQGDRVGPKVEASYLDMLAYQFMPALMLGVMEEMSRAADHGSERLHHLRVLRMLYDGSGRREDIVTDYMSAYWQRYFPGQRSVQERLLRHLDYSLAHTDLAAMVAAGDRTADLTLTPFRSSVQWAQDELGRVPTSERVYQDLQQAAGESFRAPLDLGRESGPAFGVVFSRLDRHGQPLPMELRGEDDPLVIPGMLTREGLEGYFMSRSGAVTELALIDAWVLGRRDNVDFSEADEERLRTQLQDRYADEYVAAWRQALSHLDIQRFQDLNHGVRILESLTSGHEPLAQLLRRVHHNTVLLPRPAAGAALAQQALAPSSHDRMAQEIERQFADLNQLLAKGEDQTSGLEQITEVVSNLHSYLRGIQEAPDRGKAALSAARARMALQGADPIFTLQRLADHQPAPLNRMLEKLATESWRVILDQAVAQLERQWYRDVYQPFQQTLARHYPFNPDAGRDAALQDFERFFGPEGLLNRFYQDNLKLFLEDHPEHVLVSRRASLVRRDVLAALEGADLIRQAFFTRGGTLDVEFSMEPLNLSSNKRRSVVNVDGQLVEFSHGPRQSIPLVWPNTLRETVESRITLVPTQVNRSPRSLSASGPWALFRLLDQADITGVSASAVDVRFNLDGGEMRYRLHAGSNTNPFTQQLLAGYRIPRSLY
ncbi:type VI secretion system membrane subunit TssM [Marinobacter sp. SS21]|uniref:type VI secretion system membrane subunit TssM n=1 Tax=Marinobacter sp. SS21 TaxID=2979460 RepID=UPI00232EE5BE|nr:type VI secretion system membrane subunit TssM [Marinobacter sp. SS21]MDC0662908.1 type VI secretion system membrane subunit TssM [Marinobacter sp. SS21]